MKIVVTGGIGSGKSTVCELLAKMLSNPEVTYHVYDVDRFVDEAYKNSCVNAELELAFGTKDRSKLSKMVFDDADVKAKIERIFEPYIIADLEYLLNEQDNFILEFPLLVEKGSSFIPRFDFVISVIAPSSLQISRVKNRDDRSINETEAIIQSQTTDEKRFAISDALVYNGFKASKDEDFLKQEVKNVIELMRKKQMKGKKIGIVSGSFDPITLGHTWVIQRALDIVDYVVVAIATNPTKKYLFDDVTRKQLVECTMKEVLTEDQLSRVSVDFIPSDELIVSYASGIGAKFIFRGLRGATDLEYENQLNLLQKKIAPEIETIFLLTPRELIEISSSLIKGALALREWERVAAPYISKCVLEKLKEVHK